MSLGGFIEFTSRISAQFLPVDRTYALSVYRLFGFSRIGSEISCWGGLGLASNRMLAFPWYATFVSHSDARVQLRLDQARVHPCPTPTSKLLFRSMLPFTAGLSSYSAVAG